MTTPAIRTERFVKSDHAKFLQKTENPVISFGDHEGVSPKDEVLTCSDAGEFRGQRRPG
jgi:hypothetical protein